MSLVETRQIMADLQAIMQMLQGINVKTEKVVGDTPKVRESELSLRQELRTLNMMMFAMERFTGDPNITEGIRKVQQFTMVLMRLRMVMIAFQAAQGPWGMAYAFANLAMFSATVLGQ